MPQHNKRRLAPQGRYHPYSANQKRYSELKDIMIHPDQGETQAIACCGGSPSRSCTSTRSCASSQSAVHVSSTSRLSTRSGFSSRSPSAYCSAAWSFPSARSGSGRQSHARIHRARMDISRSPPHSRSRSRSPCRRRPSSSFTRISRSPSCERGSPDCSLGSCLIRRSRSYRSCGRSPVRHSSRSVEDKSAANCRIGKATRRSRMSRLVQFEEVIAVSQQQLASRPPTQAAWKPLAVHPATPKPSLADRVSSIPDAPKKSHVGAPAPIANHIISPPTAQATNPDGPAGVPQAPMKPHITCFAGAERRLVAGAGCSFAERFPAMAAAAATSAAARPKPQSSKASALARTSAAPAAERSPNGILNWVKGLMTRVLPW